MRSRQMDEGLSHFLAGYRIGLIPAEDEDLAVMKTGTYFDEANE